MDDHIGTRVRHWRLKRGLSQRALAELAGFTQGYVAQIEAGLSSCDKRSTQAALAQALQVSVADLTGQPYDPQTLEHNAAAGGMTTVRAALIAMSMGDATRPQRPAAQLRARTEQAALLHNECRYDQLVPLLPDLLLDLHAAADDLETRRRLVWVVYATTFAAKYLGYADLAFIAAQHAQRVALPLEPHWRGVAEFALTHAVPTEAKELAQTRVNSAIAAIQPASGHGKSAQIYGMLHLTAAMFAAVAHREQDAYQHLGEADDVAQRVGEANFAQMWFGPTNAAIWRVGVHAELGEGGKARELSNLDPRRVGSRNRQATFYADFGRALAQTRRHDREALGAILQAESIAPQRVRLAPPVRETVGTMVRRSRSTSGGRELQALAKRLGTL